MSLALATKLAPFKYSNVVKVYFISCLYTGQFSLDSCFCILRGFSGDCTSLPQLLPPTITGAECTGRSTGFGIDVGTGVITGVGDVVGTGVAVMIGVGVGSGVCVGVGMGVDIGVGVGVSVGIGVGITVAVTVGVGVGVLVGTGVDVGVG